MHKNPRILLIQGEFRTWSAANRWSYTANLGVVEALKNIGIDCTVVNTLWLDRARDICQGKTFDQVWICDLTHAFDEGGARIDRWVLEWAAELAPVRLGIFVESVEYYPAEYELFPWLSVRREFIKQGYLDYMTHIAPIDEANAQMIRDHFQIPTMWSPCSVPEKLICEPAPPPEHQKALFSGTAYGERKNWLQEPKLQGHLYHDIPRRRDRAYDILFKLFPEHHFNGIIQHPYFPVKTANPIYMYHLRLLRRSAFLMWQRQVLQKGAVVVNLPHLVKGYAGRVVEGMAAGRPVVSWKIPERPLNTALFEDGKEILLFSRPEELDHHVGRVLAEPKFAKKLVDNALRKLKQFHTTEKRVRQIIRWIETGDAPILN